MVVTALDVLDALVEAMGALVAWANGRFAVAHAVLRLVSCALHSRSFRRHSGERVSASPEPITPGLYIGEGDPDFRRAPIRAARMSTGSGKTCPIVIQVSRVLETTVASPCQENRAGVMTVTLELNPELEAALRGQARVCRLSLEAYVVEVLREAASAKRSLERKSLARLFAESPLRGLDLPSDRTTDRDRPVEL